MQNPKILVSIVNWMNYWDTIECISLCKQQDYKNIEVIVVDNASKNDSISKIKEAHSDIKIISIKSNRGFAAGHKEAYKYAKKNNFDIIWLLNPDARIKNDTITTLVSAYSKNGLAIYGSITVDKNGNDISTVKKTKGIDGFKIETQEGKDENLLQVDFVSGSSFFIPMEIPRKIGFIPTKYFMYVEEVDFSYNAYQLGIPSYYVLNSKMEHEGAKSFEISNELQYIKTYYSIRNYIHFTLKIGKYSRRVIRINNGGMRAILKNAFQRKDMNLHYHALGVLHAYLGIMGRIINPERFLS